MRLYLVLTALAIWCSACRSALDPLGELRLGVIQYYGDSIRIVLPDSVRVGDAALVSVSTYGERCGVRQGETRVRVAGLLAEVAPFDSLVPPRSDVGCTLMLVRFEHVAAVYFAQSGLGTVRVRGRREPGGEAIEVERAILVR